MIQNVDGYETIIGYELDREDEVLKFLRSLEVSKVDGYDTFSYLVAAFQDQ
jgi:hypothetical protein